MAMDVEVIAVWDLMEMQRSEDLILIDVRDKEEFEKNHIEKALNIPYEDVMKHEIWNTKGKKIVLYCERGNTSLMLVKELAEKGIAVKSLFGGIRAYESFKSKLKKI